MKYHIYPPINIARVGNSDTEFFIGPETPGSLGTELASGGEQRVTNYKDAQFRVKKQAARFRLFQSNDDGSDLRPAQLPSGATAIWKTSVANLKDAVKRTRDPVDESAGTFPHPVLDPTRADRAMRSEGTILSTSGASVELAGAYLKGGAQETRVKLAELRVDAQGNLLVMPGSGISRSPEGKPIGSEPNPNPNEGGYYNNRGWFDDVVDGRINATVNVPGSPAVEATAAWVISAPPDFAPGLGGVVTLYDVVFQTTVGVAPAQPSFAENIWPILRRAAELKWVNGGAGAGNFWRQFNTNWAALNDRSNAAKPARKAEADRLEEIENSGTIQNFSLCPWQKQVIQSWVDGNFTSDFTGDIPGQGVLSAAGITRTALDAAVGQGFFPGIEAGLIVRDPALFSGPFRVASQVTPGTLTALMALPWQADFLKCSGSWWPSQRPDDACQSPDGVSRKNWIRSINGHRDLVNRFGMLGVITPTTHNNAEVHVETGRDPAL